MFDLVTNPNLNGLVSLIFSAAAFIILIPILVRQIQQFRVRRLLKLKWSLLIIVVVAILTTVPALVVQYQKIAFGDYDPIMGSISSICNGISRAVLATGLAMIYFQSDRR